jgi:MFS family permease
VGTQVSRLISSGASRYLASLQYGDFLWVWLASLAGSSAYWALIVARGVLVLDMSGSSGLVGIATFAAMAPRFVVPPLAGYLADRFNRRDVLLTAFGLNVAHNIVLTALAMGGALELWHIMALSAFNGTVRSFQMTASGTLVPNLVPRRHLLNAVSLNMATVQGSRLVGPGLIAPLLLLYGPPASFLLSTLFYAVGLVLVAFVRTRSTGGIRRGDGVAAGVAQAARFVYGHPQLRLIFLIVALHCSMTMAFESIFPVFSRGVLSAGGAGVSYLMMSVGAGSLVSVMLIAGVRSEGVRGRTLLLTGFMSGVSLWALAMSPNLMIAILSAAAMGASQGGFMAIVGATVQTLAPDTLRGRINGLNQVNIGGTMALVNLTNGFMADIVGTTVLLTVLGIGFVMVVAVSLLTVTMRSIYVHGIPSGTASATPS